MQYGATRRTTEKNRTHKGEPTNRVWGISDDDIKLIMVSINVLHPVLYVDLKPRIREPGGEVRKIPLAHFNHLLQKGPPQDDTQIN